MRALKIDGNDVLAEECGDEEKRLTDEFTELVDGLSEREKEEYLSLLMTFVK